jgi:hypothetical protein
MKQAYLHRLDTTPHVWNLSDAHEVLRDLQSHEQDGWSYSVEANGQWARIRVYDETQNFVGYF